MLSLRSVHREVRELVAELEPRPDVAPSVRNLPERPAPGTGSPVLLGAPRVEPHAINLGSNAVSLESSGRGGNVQDNGGRTLDRAGCGTPERRRSSVDPHSEQNSLGCSVWGAC